MTTVRSRPALRLAVASGVDLATTIDAFLSQPDLASTTRTKYRQTLTVLEDELGEAPVTGAALAGVEQPPERAFAQVDVAALPQPLQARQGDAAGVVVLLGSAPQLDIAVDREDAGALAVAREGSDGRDVAVPRRRRRVMPALRDERPSITSGSQPIERYFGLPIPARVSGFLGRDGGRVMAGVGGAGRSGLGG